MRVHIALRVADLPASIRFYETLLGAAPARVLPGYAQFLTDEPGLNLALTQAREAGGPEGPGDPGGSAAAQRGQHFGIEVADAAAVQAALARARAHGVDVVREEDTVCCHSRQHKFWATDPDGYRWEVFTVAERYRSLEEEAAAQAARGGSACCAEAGSCC